MRVSCSRRALAMVCVQVALSASFLCAQSGAPSGTQSGAQSGALRAGAGKVDTTPPADALPPTFNSVLDHIYARAIVLDNGHTRAALINADVANVSGVLVARVTKEVAEILDAPAANILISATHDHNAIFEDNPNLGSVPDANRTAANERIAAGMVEAVRQAKSDLQPARIGFGTGQVYLNANRDNIDAKTRAWSQEANVNYPSDKTLSVIEIQSTSGDPIAVYLNYSMHATSMFLSGEVSGEFPGEAERYLEHRFDDKAVAIWTTGAAGDQNPLYSTVEDKISSAKINAIMQAEHLEYGPALFKAMFQNDAAAKNAPVDPMDLEEGHMLFKAEGFLIAEEALRVMAGMITFNSDVAMTSEQQVITCPARHRVDTTFQGSGGEYVDSPTPVRIQIGALRIGDIALGHTSGEAYTLIGNGVKKNSPYNRTVFVTLTNNVTGAGGYMPSDDAFGRGTFEVLGTSLKPGCAETGIVNGVTKMLYGIEK